MKLTSKQTDLLFLVKEYHGSQVRKYDQQPYWTHPFEVAKILNPFCSPDSMSVEIAFLHDVLEDTPVTVDRLVHDLQYIGYDLSDVRKIERGVLALTDVYTTDKFDHMNRKERKAYEATRLAKIHPDFQTIKYADLIHNTASIVKDDKGFAKIYLAEKRDILNRMREGNLDLFVECYKSLMTAEQELLHNG